MVVLAVTWMAKTGREAEVAAILEKLTAESRKEPGCVMYQVHKHKTDPRRFFIYEQYKDDAALEAHRAAPHFLQMAKKDLPKVGGPDRRASVRAAGIVAWNSPVARVLSTTYDSAMWPKFSLIRRTTWPGCPPTLLLVGHEHAARGVAFFRQFNEGHDDRLRGARPLLRPSHR